jgi:hypothetical protein
MQITGTIKKIYPLIQVNDKFKKQEFVLTDSSTQYPQHLLMQVTQDRCQFLDQFDEGDTVTVNINLRGREWTSPQGVTKYFNTTEAWKITNATGEVNNTPIPAAKDDLPF